MSKIEVENKQGDLTMDEKEFILWYRELSEDEKKEVKNKLDVK